MMGGKPKQKGKTLDEHIAGMERAKLDRASAAMADACIFALRCLKAPGGGVVFNFTTGQEIGPWENKFFDALELVGVKFKRDEYFDSKHKKRRR